MNYITEISIHTHARWNLLKYKMFMVSLEFDIVQIRLFNENNMSVCTRKCIYLRTIGNKLCLV